jgi:hypothetical protein
MNTNEENVLDDKGKSTIICLLTESMNHLRHCEQLRATYLNFYLFLYAAAIGAIVAIHDLVAADPNVVIYTSWFIGIFVWVMGLITVARAERWTGHILHNLFTFRRLKHILQENTPLLSRELLRNPKLIATDEFRRLPWSSAKSIDTLLAILCAATGGLVGILYPPGKDIRIGIVVAVIIAVSPLIIWVREVINLEKAHKKCCFSYPDKLAPVIGSENRS